MADPETEKAEATYVVSIGQVWAKGLTFGGAQVLDWLSVSVILGRQGQHLNPVLGMREGGKREWAL